MQPDPRVVDDLVRQIVAAVRPLRVILFGSGARGELGSESDLDFLVVVPDGTNPREVTRRLYGTIDGQGQPYDLLVITASDLEQHRENIGLIYRTILREGREVYVAA